MYSGKLATFEAMLERMKHMVETGVYGVCTYLGDRMGISSSRIRLFFIYATFLTLVSPVIIYMSMAFLLRLRDYMRGFMSPLKDM